MAKKSFIWLAGFFLLLTPWKTICAQNEQWLQYHSAREINLNGFNSNSIIVDLSEKKPSDVNLPRFSGEKQLFAKWVTPMANKGFLWVVLDSSKKLNIYDILYIDSNGNGQLDDEQAIRQYRMEQNSSYFGPVKVTFKLADGPASYHLNFRYYRSNDEKRLYVSSGGWYQGEITLAGQKNQCILLDYNVNGTFNDKAPIPENSDRIRITGDNNPADTRFVGNYIEINGKFYQPDIACDGAYIKLAEAKDVKFGKIHVPENVTEMSAGGLNGQFTIKPEKGIGSLPVGKYQINNWVVNREDEKGSKWELAGSQSQFKDFFDVQEANEVAIGIGEPIVSTVTSSYQNGSYSFSQQLKGKNGESVALMRNGARPQAPQLSIKNKDGTYERTFTFSYG